MGSKKSNAVHSARTDLDVVRPFVGIGLLLISGLGFAIGIVIASMVVKEGVGIYTSNAVRYLTATVLLFIYQTITKKPIKLRPLERYAALVLGITVFVMGVGYLGATRYIPVGHAALIFYTGPFIIIFISRFTENDPITPIRLGAIGIAFLGLFFVLEVQSVSTLQIRGILFAFMGAVGMAAFVTISSLAIRNANPQAVNFHTLSSGSLLTIIFMFVMERTAGAVTTTALLTLCGSGFVLFIAMIAFYAGLKVIGPVKASMLLNTEPLFTILLAALMLGERLSGRQCWGAGLVILGIVLVNYNPNRKGQ
ncbi:MAG: DMT family transporter [Candidatus Desulfatibia sp.]|uniref:DMT family transporter n=1 Tax=Candidatus Desulfatibia sp. TaxID=3101189 RepID=UPI002F3206B0